MQLSPPDDARAIRDLGDVMIAAERAGDAALFEGILADDVVIMPPWIAAMQGAEACMEFIRSVLADLAREFDRQIFYFGDEVVVAGDVAFDRGRFQQRLVPKAGGDVIHEKGQYLRVYVRRPNEAWKLARVMWNMLPEPELEASGSSGAHLTE